MILSGDNSSVAPGLSLASHAAHCAEIFGVPARIVDRARYIRHVLLLSTRIF